MIVLMNSAMMPTQGRYHCTRITGEEFIAKLSNNEINFRSYIGYPENAKIISDKVGFQIPINRTDTVLNDGDVMLVMKLIYRPENKKNLSPSWEDFEFFNVEYSA